MDIRKPRAADWFDQYESAARYNLAESYVEPLSLGELLDLAGEKAARIERLLAMPLDYGPNDSIDALVSGIAALYAGKRPENVLVASGAINANHVVLFGLLRPGDRVVVAHPNYQQLYALPEAFGCDVRMLPLREENGFLPDPDELRALAGDRCRLIILTNPNNPTGAVIEEPLMREIAEIARACGAYLLVDEIYRRFPRPGVSVPSVCELYEKGIATCSLSKVYALCALRIGWAVAAPELIAELRAYRNYTVICSGLLDAQIAAMALAHVEALERRNRAIIETNLKTLARFVEEHPRVRCPIPRAGTFALLDYGLNVPSAELCEGLFAKTGVFVMPGSCFDMEGRVRLGFGIGCRTFEAGLRLFGEYLEGGAKP